MHSETIAIIDLGTNTFNLLIGRKSNKEIIYSLELPVMLGKGGIQNNILTEEGINRAMSVLYQFKEKIQLHGVQTVKAFATSAIRNASNGKAFAQQLEAAFQLEISTISGDTEASYIYEGAKHAILNHVNNFLVMDIGGGSVEFIIGNPSQILWKQSIEMGALRLATLFQKEDPIADQHVQDLKNYCKSKLNELMAALQQFPVNTLIGTAGPFESFKEILAAHFQIQPTVIGKHAHSIQIQDFLMLSGVLKTTNTETRGQIKGLIDFRKDLIVVGALLVESLLESYPFKELVVVDYALKEGVFFTEC